MKNPEGISVIIACYNSALVIQKTLEALLVQINCDHIAWEVLLIDNNCTDDTVSIANNVWKSKIPLRILHEPIAGEAVARKKGFQNAQYSIFSIVDDDNRVSNTWIAQIFEYFKDQKIGLIGCGGEGEFESEPPKWFKAREHDFAIGSLYDGDFVDITKHAIVSGAGLSVRKEIFDKLYNIDWKPFLQGRVGNKQSAGADSEICYVTRLLSYKIYYSNELHFKHFTANSRITWDRLKRMYEGYGASDVYTHVYRHKYKKDTGTLTVLDKLRKFWWVNYSLKLVSDLILFGPLKPHSDFKSLLKIRNKAFMDAIKQDKENYKKAFEYLDYIQKTISAN